MPRIQRLALGRRFRRVHSPLQSDVPGAGRGSHRPHQLIGGRVKIRVLRRAKACLATHHRVPHTTRLIDSRARERETVQVNSAGERSPSKERSWFLYRTPGAHLEGSWCPIALGTGACDSQRAGLQDTHDYVPSTASIAAVWSMVMVPLARSWRMRTPSM